MLRATILVLRIYFVVIAALTLALAYFHKGLPDSYILGLAIFASPTAPVVKLLHPLFEGLIEPSLLIFALTATTASLYALIAHLMLKIVR